jgi:hypothetical protein
MDAKSFEETIRQGRNKSIRTKLVTDDDDGKGYITMSEAQIPTP